MSNLHNQRTNGPVNAHLISRPTVSKKISFANLNIVLKWVKVNSQSSFIYNFVELENILLHAKFYDHTTISSVGEIFESFYINEHGSHLGHVTCTIYINFLSYFPRRPHLKKFGFDWSTDFREEYV